MKLEMNNNTIYVDGKRVTELSHDELDNLRLRLVSYLRTNDIDASRLESIASVITIMCTNPTYQIDV